MTMLPTICPDWPLTDRLNVHTTTRQGGISLPPYAALNLADHVDDIAASVDANRALLQHALDLPNRPKWLQQTHSTEVIAAQDVSAECARADAIFTCSTEDVCAVLTADCLPVVLSNDAADCVAVVHAGWRGLIHGVIENTLAAMAAHNSPSYAWLGPAIGPQAFQVGQDVYHIYTQKSPHLASCFTAVSKHKWTLDIYAAARQILTGQGVANIYAGDYCTFSDAQRFFSYRRDGVTGRMATLVWKK